MPVEVEIRDEANLEFIQAYTWYEQQQTGLGEKFIQSVEKRLLQIRSSPERYKKTYKDFREIMVETFPFLIVYFIDNSHSKIIVTAIFHTSRNPQNKFR